MIKKILEILNVGKYKSFNKSNTSWNGELKKVNIIYAHNGSGKSTFTTIMKSLRNNNDLINKKKSFSSQENPQIQILTSDKKILKFSEGKWNKHYKDIEVFDSMYAEENIYIIKLIKTSPNPGIQNSDSSFYEVLLGEENIKLRKQLDNFKSQRRLITRNRKKLSRNIQKVIDPKSREKAEMKVIWMTNKGREFEIKIKEIQTEIDNITKDNSFDLYLEKINTYIKKFNPAFKVTKLTKYGDQLVYNLEVSGHLVRTDEETHYSLKNTLSEGDKSALTLSFFLAKMSLFSDIQNKIVIFDDPISSFDNARRNTTLNELYKLSKNTGQLIMLTHDLGFAKDLKDKCNNDCLNLQIIFRNGTSIIEHHDIDRDTLTGIFKDISVLHNYIITGATNDVERREVLRCIRPSIEGMFRIKFFGQIDRNEWLGDMIKKIRASNSGDAFFRLQSLAEELSEINDYSKSYHHSNPSNSDTAIDEEELHFYVNRTLEAINNI